MRFDFNPGLLSTIATDITWLNGSKEVFSFGLIEADLTKIRGMA
jgi:hypothetical protein